MTVGAMIHGIGFVKKQFEDFTPNESKAILRRTTAGIAADVRDKMRAAVPVRTRTLKKAIVSKRLRGGRDSVEAGVQITHGRSAKHDAFYWRFVEFGTQNMEAQPFITPAYEEMRVSYRKIFKKEFLEQLQKQLAKRAKAQGEGK
jgi:HK97 gp10 family phage protein